MSDRDEDTGKFTAEEPPLYGLASVEREAGYIPLPDPGATLPPDELSLDDALPSTPEYDVRNYVDGREYDADGAYQPPKETVTLERAAKELEAAEAREQAEQEEADVKALQEEIDKLRGVQPEAKQAEEADLEPNLDAALNNPKVKEAIDAQISETETARQQHIAGLTAATQIAQAAFMSQFPEFANIPEAQRGQALLAMQQQDPARYAQIESTVLRSQELFRQHEIAHQQEAEAKRAKLESYARAESERFEDMVKSVPKAERNAIESEIVAAIKEYGGNTEEFINLMHGSEFASAVVQRLLFDVGKLRMIQNAPKAVASRTVPAVQRPGVANNMSGADMDIEALDRRLSSTGSLKDAEKLLNAKIRRASR